MKRTTGIRMTVWLGILSVCLAVFMPGVNALKNRYQASINDVFVADICSGAQAVPGPAVVLNNTPSTGVQASDGSAHIEAVELVADLTSAHASHGAMSPSSASLADGDSPASPGHSADHAVECLYCGFFSHHLPLLHSAHLPAMAYGFVSRIAPQHQHAAYYAQPAFVPLSRAPPALS